MNELEGFSMLTNIKNSYIYNSDDREAMIELCIPANTGVSISAILESLEKSEGHYIFVLDEGSNFIEKSRLNKSAMVKIR